MKYTNKLDLPEIFLKIISKDEKEPVSHRYSVTELLGNSVKEILLKRKHFNQIETDVIDCTNLIFGTAVHKIMEDNSDPEEAEVKFEVPYLNCVIVGIADNIHGDELSDYKTATTSKKEFSDYEEQILAYAWLRFKRDGIVTKKGKAIVLFKDWSKIKAANNSDYPQSPIYVHKFAINDSDYDYIEKVIKEKLILVEKGNIINCTEEERWYTGTEYAVYKNASDKRATYVTKSEEDAHNYIRSKCGGAAEIKVRKGEYLKCKYYCNCKKFCDQYNKEGS